MNIKLQVAGCRLQVSRRNRAAGNPINYQLSTINCRLAFSLVEVLVVVSLLSLIVLALMAVFSTTQRAFRSAVTQTDVLEGSRAAVDLIAADLRTITPSGGVSNFNTGPVNFFSMDNYSYPSMAYSPLFQSLPPGDTNRMNVLNYFFVLGRENTEWVGIGYAVNSTNISPLYPLYRFYARTNISSSPRTLFNLFLSTVSQGQWTNNNMSHVMDGVVHLVVRAYDPSGYCLTNGYGFNQKRPDNVSYSAPAWKPWGEIGFYFYNNVVPASVELEMGVMEDSTLARAESLSANYSAQSNYLAGQSGAVHLFRQRVTIPNVDPTAYLQ
jgi:type II secretory pathway pseudopilin PulG